jgi:hypothetical protein
MLSFAGCDNNHIAPCNNQQLNNHEGAKAHARKLIAPTAIPHHCNKFIGQRLLCPHCEKQRQHGLTAQQAMLFIAEAITTTMVSAQIEPGEWRLH